MLKDCNKDSPSQSVIYGSLLIKHDSNELVRLRLQGGVYRPDSFVSMLRYFANLKVIRYESTSSRYYKK